MAGKSCETAQPCVNERIEGWSGRKVDDMAGNESSESCFECDVSKAITGELARALGLSLQRRSTTVKVASALLERFEESGNPIFVYLRAG